MFASPLSFRSNPIHGKEATTTRDYTTIHTYSCNIYNIYIYIYTYLQVRSNIDSLQFIRFIYRQSASVLDKDIPTYLPIYLTYREEEEAIVDTIRTDSDLSIPNEPLTYLGTYRVR